MEQITREQIIGLLQILSVLPSPETKQGRGVSRRIEEVITALQAAEPVVYQRRMRPTWDNKRPWTAWEDCSKETYDDCLRVPSLHDWEHQVRALFTLPHNDEQCGEWVRSDERLPTEDDTDDLGFVWAFSEWLGIIALDRHSITEPPFYTHWKPTGLTQPQPPKTEEGSDE